MKANMRDYADAAEQYAESAARAAHGAFDPHVNDPVETVRVLEKLLAYAFICGFEEARTRTIEWLRNEE